MQKNSIKGYVDHVGHQSVRGWLASSDNDPRFAQVFCDGQEVGTVLARRFRQDLKDVGVSDGYSGFEFVFPSGTIPLDRNCLVTVQDRDTGTRINGKAAIGSLFETFGPLPDVFVSQIRDMNWTAAGIEAQIDLLSTSQEVAKASCKGGDIVKDVSLLSYAVSGMPGYYSDRRQLTIEPTTSDNGCLDLSFGTSKTGKREEATSTIHLLPSMPDYADKFDVENMERVSGRGMVANKFVANGVHIAGRLRDIVKLATGTDLREFKSILDWGVGCGRVSIPMKQTFCPEAEFVGIDVDTENITFAQKNFPEITFGQCPFFPPTDLESGKFDFVFGISVMTHLTEAAQFVWLNELRRIVKEGAIVVLSIHGAYALYNTSRLGHIAPMIDVIGTGIHDRTPDTNLGPKLNIPTYYKATYHGLDYIKKNWTNGFEIVDYFPSANNFRQDYVVLRAVS